jgi:SAM-dependent methyltransferase
MAMRPADPYARRVEAYDLVHAAKPYAAEARAIRRLVRQRGTGRERTLLDVACGTGRHLEQFAKWYDVTGLDASPAMLRVARRRLPGVRLVSGAMPRFDLGRTFDVLTCLFSAIGYVRTEAALRTTLRTFARHVVPGGLLFVEPWLTPDVWQPGRVDWLRAGDARTVVLRMNNCTTERGLSIMEFHYLIGSRGSVEHVVERHVCGLFSSATMLRAFRDAGFDVRLRHDGPFAGRGLYVARRRP